MSLLVTNAQASRYLDDVMYSYLDKIRVNEIKVVALNARQVRLIRNKILDDANVQYWFEDSRGKKYTMAAYAVERDSVQAECLYTGDLLVDITESLKTNTLLPMWQLARGNVSDYKLLFSIQLAISNEVLVTMPNNFFSCSKKEEKINKLFKILGNYMGGLVTGYMEYVVQYPHKFVVQSLRVGSISFDVQLDVHELINNAKRIIRHNSMRVVTSKKTLQIQKQ